MRPVFVVADRRFFRPLRIVFRKTSFFYDERQRVLSVMLHHTSGRARTPMVIGTGVCFTTATNHETIRA
jgi:hypothetical protein